jgi:hypothetical protein
MDGLLFFNYLSRLMFRRIVLLSVILFLGLPVFSQPLRTLTYDLKQSQHFGSGNLRSAHRAAVLWQDRLIPDTLWRETNFWRKSAGFAYRMTRYWLFDGQIDYVTALTQHEVFGHGARYREMGYQENAFHLNFYFPYGDGSGYARTGILKEGFRITAQERITEVLGGNEATQLLALDLADEMLSGDGMHYRQAGLFLITQNNLAAYIWQTRLFKNSSVAYNGDIASYMLDVNSLYWGRGETYRIKALSEQCLVSLANPIQLYAAYTLLIRYGVMGKKKLERIPMIRMGKMHYLPALNYSLSPFGSRFHLLQYFAFSKRLLRTDLYMGDQRFFPSYGLSITGHRLFESRVVTLDATIEG